MRLTRQEVYELVWSAPATAVAALLGISSASLAMTCKRRGIPTPPRGYWQKLAAGHELPSRPPLEDVDVELPMPWERTPEVVAAMEQLARSYGNRSRARPTAVDWGTAAGPAPRGEPNEPRLPPPDTTDSARAVAVELGRLPSELDEALQLARRLDDLKALDALTASALSAAAVLPAEQEAHLRDWVVHVQSAMRDLDPVKQLVQRALRGAAGVADS